MRLQKRWWLMFFFAGLLAGCAGPSTHLSMVWRDPAVTSISFNKVVVVVLNATPGQRRAMEDTLCSQFKRAQAVASYTFLTDEELKDREAAKAKIIASAVDGALLLRLQDTREQTTFVPSAATWDSSWGTSAYRYGGGFEVTNTQVRAQISLHAVPKGNVIWSAVTETINPDDAHAFAREVAEAAATELRKQKLIE